ncbi:MAG: hypothetical protein KatS3mg076_1797 [Candidatus Binatia bacterium]|nr:MAG: hypothetical protein KatS3mg076_1797 [Candidatus Binatia bacterium]
MRRFALACSTLLWLGLLPACSSRGLEERAREAADRIREQAGMVQELALSQRVPEEKVREAQRLLAELGEYMGEIHGRVDMVTVNAIEAFQASHGLEPDGMLTDETLERLRAAAEERRRERAAKG